MRKDPIEQTKEFKDAMSTIQPELDEFMARLGERGKMMGSCHLIWRKKKELLKRHGIDWHTPSECNPDILFD